MTQFIKTKLKKSDDQTNIDRYRVDTNITEYKIILRLIFIRIIIPKFMKNGNYFMLKMYVNMSKINIFKMDIQTF